MCCCCYSGRAFASILFIGSARAASLDVHLPKRRIDTGFVIYRLVCYTECVYLRHSSWMIDRHGSHFEACHSF
jgi:hypothetical protein